LKIKVPSDLQEKNGTSTESKDFQKLSSQDVFESWRDRDVSEIYVLNVILRWHPCLIELGTDSSLVTPLVEEDAGEGGHGHSHQHGHGAHAWRRVAVVLLAGANLLATAESSPLVALAHVVRGVVAARTDRTRVGLHCKNLQVIIQYSIFFLFNFQPAGFISYERI